MADFRINVIVDPSKASSGAQVVKKELDALSVSANRLRNLISGALTFVGLGYGIKSLVELADAYTQAQNRIKTVTESSGQLELVMKRLFQTSAQTGVKFESVAEVYTRTSSSVKNLGKSQEEVLKFTESLNKAVVLSGASAAEAAGGLIQLSQGLGSGRLQGQELRAILTELPAVADLIVAEFNRLNPSLNLTRGALRELGSEGKITSKIIFDAVVNAAQEMDDKFNRVTPTISRSIQTLRTNLIEMLGDFNKNTGAQGTFSRAILFVADNLDTLGRITLAVGTVIGVNFALGALGTATRALIQFTTLLLANPFLSFIRFSVLAGAALIAFGDKFKIVEGQAATFQDFARALWGDIKDGANNLADWLASNFTPRVQGSIENAFKPPQRSLFSEILRLSANTVDSIIALFIGMGASLRVIFGNIADTIKFIFKGMVNAIGESLDIVPNLVINGINQVRGYFGKSALAPVQKTQLLDNPVPELKDPGVAFKEAFIEYSPATNALTGVELRAEKEAQERIKREKAAADLLAEEQKKLGITGKVIESPTGEKKLDTYSSIVKKLQDQNAAYLLTSDEDAQVGLDKANIRARLKVPDLTSAQDSQLDSLLRQQFQLREQRDILRELKAPQDDLVRGTGYLNNLYDDGLISIDQYNQKLRELQQTALETDRTLSGGLSRGLLQIQEQFGDVSQLASSTLVNSFQTAEDAMVQFAQTGEFSFRNMVNSILQDLQRLLIRQSITAPLANALGGLTGGKDGGSNSGGFLGSALSWLGGQFFAKGDVFDSPTGFGFGSGQMGILGEAGPEGVLPLRRNSSGQLGVIAAGGNGGGNVFQTTIQVTVQGGGGDGKSDMSLANRIADSVKDANDKAMEDYLRRQGRTGGSLNPVASADL